jgi:hypothetical protein
MIPIVTDKGTVGKLLLGLSRFKDEKRRQTCLIYLKR